MIDIKSYQYIIGADECGYGAIAGPLVVGAVHAPVNWNLEGLNDSKKLSPKKREIMRGKLLQLVESGEIAFSLAERSNVEIDTIGVINALKQCYVDNFQTLYVPNSLIIVDGNLDFKNLGVDNYPKISMVKADTKIPTVMAASILAKTYRDQIMQQLHPKFIDYNWMKNVGYPTPDHLAAVRQNGYSAYHRQSYKINNLK